MTAIPSVRVQQAVVLSALRRQAHRTISIASLVSEINRGLSSSAQPITLEEVECTLSALRLRPGLNLCVSVPQESIVHADKVHRLTLGHAALASTFLLAACATPFTELSSRPSTPGYFGGDGPVMRRAGTIQTNGTPEYSSAVVDCGGFLCISKGALSIATLTTKTLPSTSSALSSVSYFNDDSLLAFDSAQQHASADLHPSPYPPRAEATIWTPHVEPSVGELRTSSYRPFSSSDTRKQSDLLSTRMSSAEIITTSASSLLIAPSVHGSSTETDHYLVTFRNGSQLITEQARLQARSIANALDPSDKIELRGRVGKTTLTQQDAKLAVARAIAVRKQLVAFGFSEKNIRIRLPKSADILDHNNFHSPVNMSVSVFKSPNDSSLASRSATSKVG